jgi:hypothetical protein
MQKTIFLVVFDSVIDHSDLNNKTPALKKKNPLDLVSSQFQSFESTGEKCRSCILDDVVGSRAAVERLRITPRQGNIQNLVLTGHRQDDVAPLSLSRVARRAAQRALRWSARLLSLLRNVTWTCLQTATKLPSIE